MIQRETESGVNRVSITPSHIWLHMRDKDQIYTKFDKMIKGHNTKMAKKSVK